jgi:large subunit ribosomal protein L6
MSKIGRKAIDISNVQVRLEGKEVHYKGSSVSGVYTLPDSLKAEILGSQLLLSPSSTNAKENKEDNVNQVWGLHRALLSNKISGVRKPFIIEVQINGLGFKAVPVGKNLVMSLGYSHKIDFPLPASVSVSVDKTGQKLTFESPDNIALGLSVSRLRALRPPEVYKGTGIKRVEEVIMRKAGKKKA